MEGVLAAVEARKPHLKTHHRDFEVQSNVYPPEWRTWNRFSNGVYDIEVKCVWQAFVDLRKVQVKGGIELDYKMVA
jgi:hypothetical protein